MGGMRNVVTHEYFQVDLNRVWETIQNDLSLLLPQLKKSWREKYHKNS